MAAPRDSSQQQRSKPSNSLSLHGMHLVSQDIALRSHPGVVARQQSTAESSRLGEAAQALYLLSQPHIPIQYPEARIPGPAAPRLPSIHSILITPPSSPEQAEPDQRPSEASSARNHTQTVNDSDDTRPRKRVRKPQIQWTGTSDQSLSYRFASNVGLWFEELTDNVKVSRSCEVLEQMATGMRMSPGDGVMFSQEEIDFLRSKGADTTDGRSKHRAARARIFIGLACVYEHNIRGTVLKRRQLNHAAFKPNGQRFVFSNMGKTQAQQLCRGVDVNIASKIFEICQQDGRLPKIGTLVQGSRIYERNPDAERAFPPDIRRRLYEELCRCYVKQGLPPEMMLVITDEDMQSQNHA